MSKIPLSENSVVHGLPRLPWRLARLPRKKNKKKKMNPQLFDSQAEGNHFHTRVPLATLFFGLLELKISWTSTTTTTTILNLQNQSIFAETIFISRNLIPGRFVKKFQIYRIHNGSAQSVSWNRLSYFWRQVPSFLMQSTKSPWGNYRRVD